MYNKLFTPGPLTTSINVKTCMNKDYGSRDTDFIKIIKNIREKLTEISCYTSHQYHKYTSVLIQGSGTYSIESVFNSCIPKNDENNKLLIVINGKYGERLQKIANKLNIRYVILKYSELKSIKIKDIKNLLDTNSKIKYLAMIHHETSTGQLNKIREIGKLLKDKNVNFILDSMSAFGAVELDMVEDNIDFLVSSSNKCLEGVPGFSFVICNKNKLLKATYSTSLCLDLLDQYNNFETNGQFRFTPPTHTLLAFSQALTEYETEGGLLARMTRYKKNYNLLKNGMLKLGFKLLLYENLHGYFITSFLYPPNNFNFNNFYNFLKSKGLIIYPGKTTNIESFRIGNIGQLFENDILYLLKNIDIFMNTI